MTGPQGRREVQLADFLTGERQTTLGEAEVMTGLLKSGETGKFVADNVWDANAVSKQCGAAVMLKALLERGGAVLPA